MIKIKNYTDEELQYIKDNYSVTTVKELSAKLNKTCGSIYNAIRKLGLVKQKHNPWTEEEIDFLKTNYITMTSEEMTKYINHSVDAINTQRDRLKLVRSKSWTIEDIDFLKENFVKLSHKEIGEKLNRSEQSVRAKCFDLNLYKKETPWSDEETQFIKENYMEMTNEDISKILNRTECAIHLKASKLGLKKYPYYCDYHYFDNIDTEEKAYWLGFLTADGWISKNDKSNAGVTGLELQYGDISHLKKFNKSISGNYKINDRWRECLISTDKTKKHHTCVIRIFSLTMYNSLIKLGFTNEKSYDAHIPNIPQELLRHYLRGYFDGDGCFCFTKKSFHVSFITASEHLNDDLMQLLNNIDIKYNTSNYISEFDTTMYKISIDQYSQKIKLLDYMYKDSNINLDRKYNKYLKAIKYNEENKP